MKMDYPLVKLERLCIIQSGGTPRRGIDGYYGGSIPWAKIGDIENSENGYLLKTEETITDQGLKSINNRIFPIDTVLLAMYGSVGKTAITGKIMATNQAILGLRPIDDNVLSNKFLKYWLDYSKNNLINKARGVALQNISATIIKQFNIPLPSLEEQKRIVKNIDHADSLRQKRKQSLSHLDEYLKSVFLDMFGNLHKNDKNWTYSNLGTVISLLTDYHANGSYQTLKKNVTLLSEPDYALMVRTTDLENNNFVNDVKYIDQHAYDFLSKSKVFGDEIIVNKIGSAGKVYLMPKLNRPVSLGMNAFLIRFSEKVDIIFMYYLLTSYYGETIIQKKVKGAVTKTIRKDAIRGLQIPLIPIDLQSKFSKIVCRTELLKRKMLKQSGELDAQFQSLMQRSFVSS
jgi:type I restriction enzyme S subunit